MNGAAQLPLSLKLAFSSFVLLLTPVYWLHYGPANFLWLCDLSLFLVALGLWRESSLLLTSQTVGTLLVQLLWSLDFLVALLFGSHPIGGTQYMFEPSIPLSIRFLSTFHLFMPILMVGAVVRLGYHRRGWQLQTLIAWVVLPICYLFTDPARNLNWLHRPFEREQTLMPPLIFFLLMMVAYPLLLYLPSDLVLRRLLPRHGQQRPRPVKRRIPPAAHRDG